MLRPYGNSIFLRYLFPYTRYELGSYEMSFVLRGLHLKLLMGIVGRAGEALDVRWPPVAYSER